jgi:hypothetical protein
MKGETTMKKKTQKMIITAVMLTLYLALFACSTAPKTQSQKDAQRDSMRAVTEQTLDSLYKNEPAAKGAVAGAAGYAVFSDFGFKVMFMGGAHGKGMAVSNATKRETEAGDIHGDGGTPARVRCGGRKVPGGVHL